MELLKKAENMLQDVVEATKKNSPTILTASAILGLFGTAVLAYRCSPKAHEIIAEKKKDMGLVQNGDKKAKRAVALATAKELTPVMLPPVIMGSATAACIIGSNTVSAKRIAVLSAAYTASEKAVSNLHLKMDEILGEKKAKTIRDAVAKEKMDQNPPPSDASSIVITGNGDVLCMDSYSGRYFRSNADKIGQAIAELSAMARDEMYVTLNDLYYALKIPTIPLGDDLGWSVDDEIRGCLPITISAVLTEDKQPCLCIDYEPRVGKEFRRLI